MKLSKSYLFPAFLISILLNSPATSRADLPLPYEGACTTESDAFHVENLGYGRGIYGSTANGTAGVYGEGGVAGSGVVGNSTNQPGVSGSGPVGLYGTGNVGVNGVTTTGFGVAGTATGSGTALYGESQGGGPGVHAYGKWGVIGEAFVNGSAPSNYSMGVLGKANNYNYAVGVYGDAGSGTNTYAGYFAGNVLVTGSFSAASKSFIADHPIDPGNKFLRHASIESSDLKNLYDGVVTTDGDGEATVKLASWFEALNGDFRYQLTVIGNFAQAIILKEISNGTFTIKTSAPNVKVSWQVTGVRHDAWAKAHPMKVEEEKPREERGKYLDPVAFGMPLSKSLNPALRDDESVNTARAAFKMGKTIH